MGPCGITVIMVITVDQPAAELLLITMHIVPTPNMIVLQIMSVRYNSYRHLAGDVLIDISRIQTTVFFIRISKFVRKNQWKYLTNGFGNTAGAKYATDNHQIE